MRKGIKVITAVTVMALMMSISGCGQKADKAPKEIETAVKETPAKIEREASTEGNEENDTTAEETLDAGQMDLIKYNYYVELNNDIVKILDNIDYYYQVVEFADEFSLVPDSGHTYGYRIVGLNSDIVDECLELSNMEPVYETLDPMVKELAEPLKELINAFTQLSRSNDYADNQYEKAKEYHAIIYPAARKFKLKAYEYMAAVNQQSNERIAEEENKMKEEGRLIAYNSSHGITIAGQIMDECIMQGVTDDNITELDLTNIKPLYEELAAVVADLDAATADNEQMIKESMSNSRPFDGLFDRMLQALEWMIQQVESGRPIEDPTLEPLGSIAHFSNTLSDCIERYNNTFVN